MKRFITKPNAELTGPPPPTLHQERSRFPAGPVERGVRALTSEVRIGPVALVSQCGNPILAEAHRILRQSQGPRLTPAL